MPHCTIECSSNIVKRPDTKLLLEKVQKLLPEVGPYKLEDIKSRLVYHDNFVVGDGAQNKAFIHCQLAILAGRDPGVKKSTSEALSNLLAYEFQNAVEGFTCSLSVEIRDMDKDSYTKKTIGS